MLLTTSTMLPLGTLVPDFHLPDVVTGQTISLSDLASKELAKLGQDCSDRDIGIIAISAKDANACPEDGPESLRVFAQELSLSFPLLYDENQQTPKDFFAACTPDFFLFDANRKLVCCGQLDDSRPSVAWNQKPSIGCNIKWKPENEPVDYKTSTGGVINLRFLGTVFNLTTT